MNLGLHTHHLHRVWFVFGVVHCLDNCIMTHIYRYTLALGSSRPLTLKSLPCPRCSTYSPFCPQTLATTDLSTVSIVLPF